MKSATIEQLNLQLIAILLVTIGHTREKNRVLTEEEMAFKLGIAPRTLRDWRNQEPPAIEYLRLPGGDVRYTQRHYEKFLADCETRAINERRAKGVTRVKAKAA